MHEIVDAIRFISGLCACTFVFTSHMNNCSSNVLAENILQFKRR